MESCKLQDVTRKLELRDKPMEIWKMSSTYIKHAKVYFTRKRFTKFPPNVINFKLDIFSKII